MRQAYWNYIEEVISIEHDPEQNNRTNTKKFWTYIQHRKKDNSTIPGLKFKGCLFTDPTQKADILNRQFQSVFSEHMKISEQEFRAEQIMKTKPSQAANDIYIENGGIQKLLEQLNPHKAAGPDVSKNLEEGKQTDVLVMDFAKAFDKVCHSLLLHKLDHYGIHGKTNRWIQAFLSDRSQVVATEGFLSESLKGQC